MKPYTTFEDFKDAILDYTCQHSDGIQHTAHDRYNHIRHTDDTPEFDAIYHVVCTGGMRGGNCWQDNGAQPFTEQVEDPGIGPMLDQFLEQNYPTLTFLQYRKLQSFVKTGTFGCSSYYGNSTDYQYWRLSFEDAWTVLSFVS